METVKNFFNNNPLFNFITFIIALLGIGITIYLYFKSVRKRKPSYTVLTNNLVIDSLRKIPIVEILYNGHKVENLSVSKFFFWNAGKETISYSDIAAKDPLRIKINDNYEILAVDILFQNNQSNDFKIELSKDQKYIDLQFEYIDYEDGVVLQMYHTGNSSSNFDINGKIKSVKILSQVFISYPVFFGKKNKNISSSIIIAVGLFEIFIGLPFSFSSLEFYPMKLVNYFSFLVGIGYFVWAFSILKRKMPKGFNFFTREI